MFPDTSITIYCFTHIILLLFSFHVSTISPTSLHFLGYSCYFHCPYKSLYFALIQSRLQYCIAVWGNSNHVKKLLLIQKRAIRIINNNNYRHHTDRLFKANQILKITDLYKYHVSSFMYDFTHHFLPGSFERYIVVDTGNKYTITTRHHHHIFKTRPRTTFSS